MAKLGEFVLFKGFNAQNPEDFFFHEKIKNKGCNAITDQNEDSSLETHLILSSTKYLSILQ